MVQLLADVKTVVRVTGTHFDTELTNLILTAKQDLELVDVIVNFSDPLTKMAIIMYVKGYFGYDNPEANRFIDSYNRIKLRLSCSVKHTTVGV